MERGNTLCGIGSLAESSPARAWKAEIVSKEDVSTAEKIPQQSV